MSYSLKEVKKKIVDGRFFSYDHWLDRLFVPPAIYVVWFCLKFGISGNAVSWISGLVAVIGGYFLSYDDRVFVLFGSFGYILWYFLDYVDGAVARLNSKGSVDGQYIDWIMHVISHVAIVSGIALGAIASSGAWIYPFAILGTLASCLAYAKFSMGWFSICMENQQRRSTGLSIELNKQFRESGKRYGFCFKNLRRLSIIIFHENFLIFSLPLFSLIGFLGFDGKLDFRILFTILSGTLYFAVQVIEIYMIVFNRRISKAYAELFSLNHKPKLPDDHFFK